MIRSVALSELSPKTASFFIRWRIKKSYPSSLTVDITDCLEILLAMPIHHKDTSFDGSLVFDNLIDLKEFKLGFDGDEPIDMMLYYIEQYITDRLKKIIVV